MTWQEASYWCSQCKQAMIGVTTDYCLLAGRPAPSYVIVLYDQTHTPVDVLTTPSETRRYIDQCLSLRWQRRFAMHGVKHMFDRHT